MHWNSLRTLFGVLTGLLIISAPLVAQMDRATLNGTITDSSGGTMVGAKVTAVHQGSGLMRTVKIPESGTYMMPQLPIGEYAVTVEASGFKTVRFEKVVLQV